MPPLRQRAMDCLKSLFRRLIKPKSEPEKALEIVSRLSTLEYQQDSDRKNREALPTSGRKSSPFLPQRNRKFAFWQYSASHSTRRSTDQGIKACIDDRKGQRRCRGNLSGFETGEDKTTCSEDKREVRYNSNFSGRPSHSLTAVPSQPVVEEMIMGIWGSMGL